MKVLREFCLSILITFFLISGVTSAQSPAKAIKLNPKSAEAYNNRGLAYDKKGQTDRAIRDYTKAIKLNPKYAKAYYNRGVVYENKGQTDRAIRDWSKALEINPRYAEPYENRGFTYFTKLGNTVKGCADLKKACELGECKIYKFVKQTLVGACP